MYLVNNFYCFLCFSPCCVPVEILEHKDPDFPHMEIIDLVAVTYHYNPNCILLMLSYTISNPKTFLRIGSYYKTTIDNLKIMNHLKLLTKYN